MNTELAWDTLAENTRQVFDALTALPLPSHFYLAGGTGLALQIGHRISYDLDFFTSDPVLDLAGRSILQRQLESLADVTIRHESDGQLYAIVQEVEVSFIFQHHPLLFSIRDAQGINLADPTDIGLMKLAAVKDRGTRRDFVDLYCLRQKAPFALLFDLIPRKFYDRPDFAVHLAYALSYFEDAEQDPRPLEMRVEAEWTAVKAYCLDGSRLLSQINAGLVPPKPSQFD
ncbi:MAG: nucleotidyl transferase AbiEii/AbiGii toxin family protein [Caldilineaceae bacterium]|nr:nucleotidyl transferase AbiEii/AbiGii toxin family protein [Caldilineaceae bacterium]HRJ43483.1 nucleotidyl transferase AbiEii/AbiGii toxin family protein [Caldilineaceae bacterium]